MARRACGGVMPCCLLGAATLQRPTIALLSRALGQTHGLAAGVRTGPCPHLHDRPASIPLSVRAMKAGAVDFVTTPFRVQDMPDAVLLAIDRGRTARDGEEVMAALQA